MTAIKQTTKNILTVRLYIVCAVATTVGLPMAWISIGKFVLFISALTLLTGRMFNVTSFGTSYTPNLPRYTTHAVLIALTVFGISLLWTTAQPNESLGSLAKYGKLLTIILLTCMLKNRQEVLFALIAFIAAQIFLVLSSWMLYFGMPVPWATSRMAASQFAVFSTYLDQAIMSATAAAVCWHLRSLAPGRYGRFIAISIALLCLFNVLFVLIGRSGHIVAISLLSLAVMWELPRRFRWLVVTLPLIFLLIFSALSQKVQSRIEMVKNEVAAFSINEGTNLSSGTSSGIRLHFWYRAVQSIKESPLVGSGVGSWSNEYNRLERKVKPEGLMVGERGNPHQEYLMWGVQLGVPGILLLLALMMSIMKDTLSMETHTARATQSCLLALAVSCLFNSSLYDAQIGDFFCVVLGLLLALGLHPQNSMRPAGPSTKSNNPA
jgi:O-antigen ligase